MWNLTSLVSFLKSPTTPLVTCLRFYERRRVARRFGYIPHYHSKGLLPRIPNDKLPLKNSTNSEVVDPWRPKAALFGENDYIDILSDDKINPSQLLQNVPYWLRKFRGNEMQMLIRKRTAKNYWKWSRPHKWHQMNKQIDFLYKRLNYKHEPKKPEYPWGTPDR